MQKEVTIIGAGMAGLTAAVLLAEQGVKVQVLEKNWLPGGCSSSYPRKHYIFESGATTLVGLDKFMPLRYVLDKTGIDFPVQKLDLPMQVRLKNGKIIHRYQDINTWITEAERVFGKENQRPFWEKCYQISQKVWEISLEQKNFPPSTLADLFQMVKNFRPHQLAFLPYSFQSMQKMLKKYQLDKNTDFVEFVNEQLLITAQNHAAEVNMLFGATALCYTNFGNYYVAGGLLEMIKPFVNYIEEKGGSVLLREGVEKVSREGKGWKISTQKQEIHTDSLIFAIPINNALELLTDKQICNKFQSKVLLSEQLNSAFTMGAVFKRKNHFESIHQQIHLSSPLPYTHSKSIFVSMSQSNDVLRCGADEIVLNISTHVHNPENNIIEHKKEIEDFIFSELEQKGLFAKEDLIFHHSSTPKSWQKWTSRKWGFVGGYPQYMSIKPWQMLSSRLEKKTLYICGDSTYPGQGIPGAALSGIIAVEKWQLDNA